MDAGGSLLPRLQRDQANARREQLKDRVLLLGMIISEVKNREIELHRDATDDDVVDVIRKGINHPVAFGREGVRERWRGFGHAGCGV